MALGLRRRVLMFLRLYGLHGRGTRSLRWDSIGRYLIEKNAVSLALQGLGHLFRLLFHGKGAHPHSVILPRWPLTWGNICGRKPLAHELEHCVRLSAVFKSPHLDFIEDRLQVLWTGGFFGHHYAHPCFPRLHDPNAIGSGTGEVDDAPRPLHVGPAVSDLDLDLLPGLQIFYHYLGAEWEG